MYARSESLAVLEQPAKQEAIKTSAKTNAINFFIMKIPFLVPGGWGLL
jgi:hypothetical protein